MKYFIHKHTDYFDTPVTIFQINLG